MERKRKRGMKREGGREGWRGREGEREGGRETSICYGCKVNTTISHDLHTTAHV